MYNLSLDVIRWWFRITHSFYPFRVAILITKKWGRKMLASYYNKRFDDLENGLTKADPR